jgi:hypothetical protein
MGSKGQSAALWGQRGQNRQEHEKLLKEEAHRLLEMCAPTSQEIDRNGKMVPKKSRNIPPIIGKQFLTALVEFLEGEGKIAGIIHQGEGLSRIWYTRVSDINIFTHFLYFVGKYFLAKCHCG